MKLILLLLFEICPLFRRVRQRGCLFLIDNPIAVKGRPGPHFKMQLIFAKLINSNF